MQTVFFDNKEYTKVSVLAKRFNYTSDYIGQLCRAEKVDSKLVGRSWYVTQDSLNKHRSGRYKKTSQEPPEVQSSPKENNFISHIEVEPILNKKVVKMLKSRNNQLVGTSVRYESDDNVLIPRVEKALVSKLITIHPATAEKPKVQINAFKPALYKPKLKTEFVSSGRISVSDYPKANPETSSIIPNRAEVSSKNSTRIRKFKPLINPNNPAKDSSGLPMTKENARTGAQKTSFSPNNYTQITKGRKSTTVTPRDALPVLNEVPQAQRKRLSLVFIGAVFFTAIAISAVLLSIATEIHVSQASYNSSLVFQLDTFLHVFELLSIHIRTK